MEKDLVSVIIPVYNVATYLEKCIESVIAQTYENIQIILINDGSTDNSKKICEKYALLDNRIDVIEQKNEGVSSARNKGLEHVKGKYICFVDSDDYVEHNFIEVLVDNLKNNQMSICGFDEIVNKKEVLQTFGEIQKMNQEEALYQLLLEDSFRGYLWNKLFVTQIVKEYGICFEKDISVWEDVLFVFQYMLHIEKIVYDPKPLYNYVFHEKSASHGEKDFFKAYSAIEAKKKMLKLVPGTYNKVIIQLKARFLTSALNILRMDAIMHDRKNKTYCKKSVVYIRKYAKVSKKMLTKSDRISVILCLIHPALFQFLYRISR